MFTPSVFVVILNYNGGEDTIKCIGSLQRVAEPALSIIIVDNASTDDSVLRIKKEFPDTALIQSPTNTGYAGGNNLGIRKALADGATHILVMNNDMVVQPNVVTSLLDLMQRDPLIGVTTCQVRYMDQRSKVFAGPGRLSRWMCTGMNKGGYYERHFYTNRERIVDFACGVLFLARREVFENVGLLDERYFMYFEDVEFSRRLLGRFKVGYTPAGIAYHKSGGGTSILNYSALYNYYHTRNRLMTYADEEVSYRFYVALFSFLNICVKSFVQIPTALHSPRATWKRVAALWRGFRDGLRLLKGASIAS